jgi:hypothetical protein
MMDKGQVEFLKLSAFIFMICDHVGAYLLPDIQWLRIIGRLAFPLFAYALVQGFQHTSDFQRYSRRVLLLAAVWQVPYAILYASGYIPASEPFNFVFILFLGLILLDSIKERKFSLSVLIFLVVLLLDVLKFSIPYGSYGLAFIVAIYFFDGDIIILSIVSILLTMVPIFAGVYPWNQLFACLFLAFLIFQLSIRSIHRMFYYFAYPIHLAIIFGVKSLCGV